MAGLAILKHTYDLSDEVLCERWVENPYYQFFCGEEFFQHRLVFDRSSLTRWRQRMGEERLQALLQESLSVATRTEAIKPSELSRVIVDTTVQPKNVTFPTDAKLLNRAREKLVRLAQKPRRGFAPVLCAGGQVRPDQASALCPRQAVQARQQGAEEAADLSRPRHPRHRPQDRGRWRARSGVRKAAGAGPPRARAAAAPARAEGLFPARAGSRMHRQGQGPPALRVRRQGLASPPRSAHAKGGQFVTHVKALPGNPYDGHTLATVIPDMEALIGNTIERILADKGYRGHNAPPDYKFRVFISGQKRAGDARRSNANCAAGPPSSPSSAISKPSTAWAATISGYRRGDATNAVLAAAGYNFRRLIRWLRLLLRQILGRSPRRTASIVQPEIRVLHGRLSKAARVGPAASLGGLFIRELRTRKGGAFGIVFRKPDFRDVGICKHLLRIADLLAGVGVDCDLAQWQVAIEALTRRIIGD